MRRLLPVLIVLAALGCGSQSQQTNDTVVSNVDECPVAGAYKCSGDTRVVCAEGDGRLVWVTAAECSKGCSAGKCVEGATCADNCPGESVAGCSGDKLMICLAGDGCLGWATAATCSFGCVDGRCNACEPDCTGRECGNDPVCGTSCGKCQGEENCNNGVCEGACEPDCTGLECGNDPICETSCGTCTNSHECQDGICQIVQTNCDENPSQGLSQPCCVKYGVDACGAGLFCAAFDGRTIPSCYAEHVRSGLQECGEDLHCASYSCNEDTKKCKSMLTQTCTLATSCTNYLLNYDVVCDAESDDVEGLCATVGNGEVGDLCANDENCDSEKCNVNRCARTQVGGYCDPQKTEECDEGLTCAQIGSSMYNGLCTDGLPGSPCTFTCNDSKYIQCVKESCVQKLGTGEKCSSNDDCFNAAQLGHECDSATDTCLRTVMSICESNSQCQNNTCVNFPELGFYMCYAHS